MPAGTKKPCECCGDAGPTRLRARCHPKSSLRVMLHDNGTVDIECDECSKTILKIYEQAFDEANQKARSETKMAIEPGEYKAVNKEHFFTQMTKKDGEPLHQFCVVFEIMAGKNAGQRLSWRGGIGTSKSFDFTKKAMITMGWDERTDPVTAKMNKEVIIVVENEITNGKTYATVKFINSLDGASVGIKKYKATDEQAKSINDTFMSIHRQQQASKGEDVQSGSFAPDGSEGGAQDDDLPF
jgi:hypothetical protein